MATAERTVGGRLVEGQAVQQPLQLPCIHGLGCPILGGGPVKMAALQSLVVQPLCRKIGYAEILRSIPVKARQPGASGTGTQAISG